MPEPFPLAPATGQDYVRLLPRDPDWAYVFWEVTAAGVSRCKGTLSQFGVASRLVLRMYCLGEQPGVAPSQAEVIEVTIDSWLGSRVVMLGRPGELHQAVIGFRDERDTFVPLARSALVRSPAGTRALSSPQRYARVQRVHDPDHSHSVLKVTFVESEEFRAAYRLDTDDPPDPPHRDVSTARDTPPPMTGGRS